MPIYEYQCGRCGHRLEALQKLSEPPLTDCPECHEAALERLISAAAFHLKGTGWYATDFRDKGRPKEKKADGEGDAKGDADQSAKSDGTKSDGVEKKSAGDGGSSEKGSSEKGSSEKGSGGDSGTKSASAPAG